MKSKEVFANAKWIVFCKIIQSLLQLVVGMLCARYLGPANYGLINYAASVTGFALTMMKLGFDATLVRELVEAPEKEGEIMGTSLALNVISGLLCMAGVAAFVSTVNRNEPVTLLVCVLYSTMVFFGALEMIQYWFQYKLMSKYPSLVMLAAYVVVSCYRIGLLITGKSVYWFALTNALDYAIIGISLIVLYGRLGGGRFCFSRERAKSMLAKSRYYILASLMIRVIQNTDHVMLTMMVGQAENGFYSAAITCATVVQFVYVAIVDSFRPMILEAKKEKQADFEESMEELYCIILYLAITQVAVFFLFAGFIVRVMYGEAYLRAGPVLRVLLIYLIFSQMGTVRNVWILAEQKQKYLPWINFSGAAANVVLNAVMIPLWGACGAAAASALTQFFANFVMGFAIKPMRPNNRLILRSLHPATLIRVVRKYARELGAKAE